MPAHVAVALVVHKDDAEVRAGRDGLGEKGPVHVRVPARLPHERLADTVEIVPGPAPLLENRRARNARDARGHDAQGLARGVRVERGVGVAEAHRRVYPITGVSWGMTPSALATPITASEYAKRRETLLARLGDAKGFVWWGSAPIFYLSGFSFVPTERPIALLLSREGEAVLLVPRLELEHAQTYALIDRVETYPEYPDARHPLHYLTDLLRELNMSQGELLGDGDGYGRVMGYRGPKLSELLGVEVTPFGEVIDEMMYVKSEHEIALIRESARWAARAHRLLQDFTRVGLNESEVSERASADANRDLLAEYGGAYRALAWGRSGPFATYRGQVGEHSALPHSLNINAVFKEGDTLVTGASCPMFGYYSELERTMFVSEPDAAQRRYFGHMLALQDLAIERCRAGETLLERRQGRQSLL